ncbi:MAG: type II toxin-antitoxin system VapC family toxin [Bryobacteraceae bacterium]
MLGFEDESNPEADVAFRRVRTEEALVPSLWWFEVRNTLVVRRRRITESDTVALLARLSRLPVRVDRLPDESALLRLARTHRPTVYDVTYLELAQRVGMPLATLDAELRRAAAAEGLPLMSGR